MLHEEVFQLSTQPAELGRCHFDEKGTCFKDTIYSKDRITALSVVEIRDFGN